MPKISIDTNAFVYPMPMVIVGALVEGKPNFMAVGWVSRVNFKPPMIAVALGPHHTNKGIEENRAFSVNIPDCALIDKTDYCGLVTGSTTDKSRVFDVFYGDKVPVAPLIAQCPLCMACTLAEQVSLPFNTLYIGKIEEVVAEQDCLTDGRPDVQKLKPFTLTMPDNNYWAVGANVGRAWSTGKALKRS